MLSCIMAVLAINFTTWTLSFNMTGKTLSLHDLPTFVRAIHFLKIATIAAFKVDVNSTHFTLPLTSFIFVCAVYEKIIYLSFKTPVWVCAKLFFATTAWTTIRYEHSLVQTRLANSLSLTTFTCHVRVSTWVVTYYADIKLRQLIYKVVTVSTNVLGCFHYLSKNKQLGS